MAKHKMLSAILIVIALMVSVTVAQDDYACGVATDQNDNIIVCGIVLDDNCVTIKYNSQGDILWIREYDSGSFDGGFGVAVAEDSNIYVVGYTGYNLLTIKYTPDGDTVWTRVYDSGSWNCAYDVALASNGDVIVAGSTDYVYLLIRYSPNGDVIWTRTHNFGGWFQLLRGVAVDNADNIVACGTDTPNIIKCNANGDTLWTRNYSMGWAEASDIYTQPDNNILVVGTNGYSGCPIKLIKYDPNGNLIDADSVGMDWYGLDVAMVEDSNVVVTGGIGGQPNYTSIPLLVKFNGQGDTLWTTTYELPPGYISGKGYAIAVDSEDHVIIAGDVEDPDRIGDILVIKYGLIPGGAQILWSRIYDSGALQPPTIQSVTDIPDDQGKWVRVTWSASPNDSSNSPNPITLYGIWRRIDTLSTRAGSGLTLPDSKEVIRFEGWDGVGTVAAVQESIYNFVSPTLVDSNATGINYSVFMITAHAQNPFDWIASEPDSGYSVDNIPPEPPYDLVAEVINNDVLLTWQVLLGYPDFSHFAVYRDTLAGFTPGDVNRIGTSEVAAYTDSSLAVGIYYYVVSALDVNGNESGYSNEVEAVITGIEEAGFDIPVSHALSQNHPNPFRVQTAISYELPRPGLVTIAIYNVAGQRIKTLVEEKKDAGYHTVPWDGRSNDGKPVSNGVYFCRMEVDEYTSVKKILLTR